VRLLILFYIYLAMHVRVRYYLAMERVAIAAMGGYGRNDALGGAISMLRMLDALRKYRTAFPQYADDINVVVIPAFRIAQERDPKRLK